jgi:hypothetical protein
VTEKAKIKVNKPNKNRLAVGFLILIVATNRFIHSPYLMDEIGFD